MQELLTLIPEGRDLAKVLHQQFTKQRAWDNFNPIRDIVQFKEWKYPLVWTQKMDRHVSQLILQADGDGSLRHSIVQALPGVMEEWLFAP